MHNKSSHPFANTAQLRDRLATGDITAVELAQTCIDRIASREADVAAWAWFDADTALDEARRLDAHRASSAPLGPLHGMPIGVKDVIDTKDAPTENGCPLDAGRMPDTDAAVVARLKEAGAIMFGKTVTTELAFMHPGKTRHPLNPAHTPGGSSSGSAAAVADGMIPLAIGTQTGGSVIRPASFCGVTGFKPTFNAVPRDGVLLQSHSLDTVGVFAADPGGTALLAEVLSGPDAGAGMFDATQTSHSDAPVFAFVKPPAWDRADPALQSALTEFCETLDAQVIAAELPDVFDDVAAQRAVINNAEMAHHFARYMGRDADKLGQPTRDAIMEGRATSAPAYLAALDRQSQLRPALEPIFAQCDAILCPAALGPASEGLHSTGDSIFNGLWTMAGTPAVTLPLMTAPNGLPMGVQLVGQPGQDAKLLNVAQWLWTHCGGYK